MLITVVFESHCLRGQWHKQTVACSDQAKEILHFQHQIQLPVVQAGQMSHSLARGKQYVSNADLCKSDHYFVCKTRANTCLCRKYTWIARTLSLASLDRAFAAGHQGTHAYLHLNHPFKLIFL